MPSPVARLLAPLEPVPARKRWASAGTIEKIRRWRRMGRSGKFLPTPQPVAGLLREYAQRTALRGGNPYRAKAYARAADSLGRFAGAARSTDFRGPAY